jgi:8-oxo-dGTP diphosphatase
MKLLLAKIWRSLGLRTNIQLLFMRVFNDEFLVGLTGIFFDDQDKVLLLKHSYRETQWSLPGGYLKAREHPIEGLEREIAEETGFVISVDKELKVRTDRHTGRLDICYMGKFIGGEFKRSDEVIAYGLFSFDELPLLLKDQVVYIDYALRKWQKMKQAQ